MLVYTLLLLPLATSPYFLGAAGPIYLAGSAILGLLFVAAAIAVIRDPTEKSARRMFGFSMLYLFLLFGLLMIDCGPGLIARLGA
jgi:protoheme IX farnesyltransferase